MSAGVGYIFGSLGGTGKTSLLARLSGASLRDRLVANALFPWRDGQGSTPLDGATFDGHTAANHPWLAYGSIEEFVTACNVVSLSCVPFNSEVKGCQLGRMARVTSGTICSVLVDDEFKNDMSTLLFVTEEQNENGLRLLLQVACIDGKLQIQRAWFDVTTIGNVKFEHMPALEVEGRCELAMAFVSPNVEFGRPKLATQLIDFEKRKIGHVTSAFVDLIRKWALAAHNFRDGACFMLKSDDDTVGEYTSLDLVHKLEAALLQGLDNFENGVSTLAELSQCPEDWLTVYRQNNAIPPVMGSTLGSEIERRCVELADGIDAERLALDLLNGTARHRDWTEYLRFGFWKTDRGCDALADLRGKGLSWNRLVDVLNDLSREGLILESSLGYFDNLDTSRKVLRSKVGKHLLRAIVVGDLLLEGETYDVLCALLTAAAMSYEECISLVAETVLRHETKASVRSFEAKKRSTEFVIVTDDGLTTFSRKPFEVQLSMRGLFWVDSINALTFKLGGHALPGGVLAELVDWRVNNLRGHGIITYAPSTLANPLRANVQSVDRHEWFDESLVNGRIAISFAASAAPHATYVDLNAADLKLAGNADLFDIRDDAHLHVTAPSAFTEAELWPANNIPTARPVAVWITDRATHRRTWHLVALDAVELGLDCKKGNEGAPALIFNDFLVRGPKIEGVTL